MDVLTLQGEPGTGCQPLALSVLVIMHILPSHPDEDRSIRWLGLPGQSSTDIYFLQIWRLGVADRGVGGADSPAASLLG